MKAIVFAIGALVAASTTASAQVNTGGSNFTRMGVPPEGQVYERYVDTHGLRGSWLDPRGAHPQNGQQRRIVRQPPQRFETRENTSGGSMVRNRFQLTERRTEVSTRSNRSEGEGRGPTFRPPQRVASSAERSAVHRMFSDWDN